MHRIPWWVHPALILAGLLYGGNYRMAKEVMDHYLGPYGLNLIRVFTAVLVFWTVGLAKMEKVDRSDYPRFVLCALLGASLNIIIFFQGLYYTTPINASLILTTLPIVVLLASYFLLGESFHRKQILGILLGLSGAFLLINTHEIDFSNKNFWGDVLVFFNTASYAFYLVLVKPLMSKYHPLTVLKWIFSLGLLLVAPLGIEQLLSLDLSEVNSFGVIALVYVAFATTVFAYFLNINAIRYLSSTIVGYYIYLQPLFAGLIEVIFGGQKITLQLLISAVLIFGGVFLVSNKQAKKKNK